MSNPNRQHFSVEPDDERSLSDSEPLKPKAPITPDNLRFLFDKQKSEEAAFRQYENDGEDADTVGPGKRRKKAARSLKGLFKSRNLAAKAEKKAAATQLPFADQNVIPLNSRRRSSEDLPQEQDFEEPRKMASQDTEPELEADVQETFRVDPDAADSPNHQAAEEMPRGTHSNREHKPSNEAPASGGSDGGGGYDGPPLPPVAPIPPTSPDSRVEDFLPPAAVHNPIRVLPAPVERRGGIAGPLTAFFAANYLSRRRNRRARKETNKLKTELKDTQRQQQVESRRLRSIEDSIRNNHLTPVVAPTTIIESKKAATVTPRSAHESSPTKVAEILAASAVNKNNLTQKPPKEEQGTFAVNEIAPQVSQVPEPGVLPPKDAPKPVAKELRQLTETQIEQGRTIQALQQEQGPKLKPTEHSQVRHDNVLETRKVVTQESVDDSSSVRVVQNNATTPKAVTPRVSQASGASSHSSDNTPTIRTSQQPMVTDDQQRELYRKSMRAGVVTGIAVAGLGVLAYIILL